MFQILPKSTWTNSKSIWSLLMQIIIICQFCDCFVLCDSIIQHIDACPASQAIANDISDRTRALMPVPANFKCAKCNKTFRREIILPHIKRCITGQQNRYFDVMDTTCHPFPLCHRHFLSRIKNLPVVLSLQVCSTHFRFSITFSFIFSFF